MKRINDVISVQGSQIFTRTVDLDCEIVHFNCQTKVYRTVVLWDLPRLWTLVSARRPSVIHQSGRILALLHRQHCHDQVIRSHAACTRLTCQIDYKEFTSSTGVKVCNACPEEIPASILKPASEDTAKQEWALNLHCADTFYSRKIDEMNLLVTVARVMPQALKTVERQSRDVTILRCLCCTTIQLIHALVVTVWINKLAAIPL